MRRKREGRGGEEDDGEGEEEGKLVPLAHSWMGFQDADITVKVTGMGVTVCVRLWRSARSNVLGGHFVNYLPARNHSCRGQAFISSHLRASL